MEELSALGPSLGGKSGLGKPVLGWRQKVHKTSGLGSDTPQKLQVKVLELDEKTRHTLVRIRHGDDQERRLIHWNQIWAQRQKIHRRPQARRKEGSTSGQ